MEGFVFGIPKQRREAVEKYPHKAVLTVCAAPTEKGLSYRFELNSVAIEMLNLLNSGEEHVTFAFQKDGVFLANALGMTLEDSDKYRVTKAGTFSNAKVHKFLTKFMKLDKTIDNEFELFIVNSAPIVTELREVSEDITEDVINNTTDILEDVPPIGTIDEERILDVDFEEVGDGVHFSFEVADNNNINGEEI